MFARVNKLEVSTFAHSHQRLSEEKKVIEIDGSFGEGGGQVLRTSIALSGLLARKIHVKNIRAKRPNPGLRPQHITAVKAVTAICDAETSGLQVGSTDLLFSPRKTISGSFKFDVGTAGSISLVLQALMPTAAFSPSGSEFEITGGTDVRWSPTIDYVRFVVLRTLSRIGYLAELKLIRRGHYPKGGGRVSIKIQPCRGLSSLTLNDRHEIKEIRGVSHCVRLPGHVAQRQTIAAQNILRTLDRVVVNVVLETYPRDTDPHIAPGSGVVLYTDEACGAILGADSIGERGKTAEEVGSEAGKLLLEEIKSNAPVDRHMSDILIPYLAVAQGTSEFRTSEITMHTITNARIVKLLSGAEVRIEGELGNPGTVTVRGIGLES